MTTTAQVSCPECGLPWLLVSGKLPPHTAHGDPCPMSGREPRARAMPPGVSYVAVEPVLPPLPSVTTVTTAEAPAVGPRQCKVRSDVGSKRRKLTQLDKENIAAEREQHGAPDETPTHVTPKPKRQRRGYIVARDYTTFASLEEAKALLAKLMEEWEAKPEGAEGDPPALIAGRVLRTKYEPPRTIAATVKVAR